MRKRPLLISILVLLVFLVFRYLDTGSRDEKTASRPTFEIVAHRGVSQTFHKDDLDNDTCTASRIYRPRHEYLENTVESIQAAFDYGATIVEIDVRPTKDRQLVVFHDNVLGCRTNGSGKVSDHSVAELKQLDVGYGYTFDGGKTYPFRGKGIGKIHTLGEILSRFPNKRFLIDNKNGNNREVARMLVDSLSQLSIATQKNIFLWSQDVAFEYVNSRLPGIKRLLLPRGRQKEFFTAFLLSIGMKRIDASYKDQGLGLPAGYTKYIWGWPNRFLNKLHRAGARFYLYVNDPAELKSLSGIPLDGVITDNVDIVGRRLNERNRQIEPT